MRIIAIMAIFETPIALIIFNRPDQTSLVMERLRILKPAKLLIVADGPRPSRPSERALCEETQSIALNVDWDCEVLTNFSKANLGCKDRVISGLDWVFSCVERAIILEDDCLPDDTFFPFCAEMLERFRNDTTIGMVSGNNYLFGMHSINDSYYASHYPHIWGWATWRRAWALYDPEMKTWCSLNEDDRTSWHQERRHSRSEATHWNRAFNAVAASAIDTWDFQWVFTMFQNHMLSIAPKANLVSNTGIGAGATHTQKVTLEATARRGSLNLPLVHPPRPIKQDERADLIESRLLFSSSLPSRLARRVLSIARDLYFSLKQNRDS
jgi:hypothetical protein